MRGLRPDAVGIVPPGALGVAHFHHLTAGCTRLDGSVVFLEHARSASSRELRASGLLRIADASGERAVDVLRCCLPDLLETWEDGRAPGTVLVCANADQVFGYVDTFVRLVERQHAAGGLDPAALPALVLCANGIYFQRMRQVLVERLEEATLLGRLPDLWPALLPGIVGRVLRGVTIQTGLREGVGPDALYRPGPRGPTTVAGGDAALRAAVVARLAALGGDFTDGAEQSPTRVEFQKALINLNSNLIGLLAAIGDDGSFRALTVGEIYVDARRPQMEELIRHGVAVAQAVRAFRPDETAEAWIERVWAARVPFARHVPSSLQWLDQQVRLGAVEARVPSTEAWLLDPLLHYARNAQLPVQAAYFEGLRTRLVEALARVCRRLGLPDTAGS